MYLPDLKEDFNFTDEEIKASPDDRNGMMWKGGEKAGLERLEHYVKNCVKKYNDTRNNFLGADYSSKLSPWISNGSLSIRYIYRKVTPASNPQV